LWWIGANELLMLVNVDKKAFTLYGLAPGHDTAAVLTIVMPGS
jgi:hypothetical protein